MSTIKDESNAIEESTRINQEKKNLEEATIAIEKHRCKAKKGLEKVTRMNRCN